VPCYNLAHFLEECVESILVQSFQNFEVLIMDDCSPDDTAVVAAAFTDPRVRHIRHVSNVGHLRNYNIGIEQARGKYLWLISADDRLRSAKVLERFVNVFEADPEVTLAFCSGLYLTADGREGAVIGRVYDRDCIVSSDVFVGGAIKYNLVCTPGAMAHTQSYRD